MYDGLLVLTTLVSKTVSRNDLEKPYTPISPLASAYATCEGRDGGGGMFAVVVCCSAGGVGTVVTCGCAMGTKGGVPGGYGGCFGFAGFFDVP